MDSLGNQYTAEHGFNRHKTEATRAPVVISRCPYPCVCEEKDMNSKETKRASFKDPWHLVNPRGPHYSGNQSRRSTSSYTSSSDTSESSYSGARYNGGQQYQGQRTNLYPGQYYDRQTLSSYVPPSHYQQGGYTQASGYYDTSRYQGPSYSPPSRPSNTARQLSTMVKAHSTENYMEPSSHNPSSSQRGYSSLGDSPNEAVYYSSQEFPRQQQLPSTYRVNHYDQYSSGQSGYSSEVTSTTELSEGMGSLSVHPNDDIEIVTHPRDYTAVVNERVVFTCEARVALCEEEPNLLWFKDQEPLIGEIDSTYVIEETTEKDAGVYHCLVTHPLDSAQEKESFPATLTVNNQVFPEEPPLSKLPVIVSQPLGTVMAVVGDPLELTIQANGEEPLQYQWYRYSQPLNFAKSADLRFPRASMVDGGDYCCRISNPSGSILSKVFHLEVTKVKAASNLSDAYLHKTSITLALQLRSIESLQAVLKVGGSIPPIHRGVQEKVFYLLKAWRDSTNGAKASLDAALKNLVLKPTGSEAPRSSGSKLQFLKQPQGSKVIYGQSVNLQVIVLNVSSRTTYQWYLNRKCLIGKNSPLLIISSVVESDAGEYICVVKDSDHEICSEPVLVELDEPTHKQPPRRTLQNTSKPFLVDRGGPVRRNKPPPIAVYQHTAHRSTRQVPESHGIKITEHPQSVDIEPGDPLTLNCQATGPEPGELKYNWYFNGLLIKDEEQSEYLLNCFTDEDEGFYSCKVSNRNGLVLSNTAQVKVKLDSD